MLVLNPQRQFHVRFKTATRCRAHLPNWVTLAWFGDHMKVLPATTSSRIYVWICYVWIITTETKATKPFYILLLCKLQIENLSRIDSRRQESFEERPIAPDWEEATRLIPVDQWSAQLLDVPSGWSTLFLVDWGCCGSSVLEDLEHPRSWMLLLHLVPLWL